MMSENLENQNFYLNILSSESNSDADEEEEMLLLFLNKKYKSPNNSYLSKRKSHGQFKMTAEFPDEVFTNFFRVNRDQFNLIHEMIKESLQADGCNAQKPIDTQEKLAVFLR